MLDAVLDRGGHAPSITSPCPPPGRQGRRLQRPRTKGYKTPEGVVYAGRHSHLVNPFERRRNARGGRRFRHARGVELHRAWLEGKLGALSLERLGFSPAECDALARLRRRVLASLPGFTAATFNAGAR